MTTVTGDLPACPTSSLDLGPSAADNYGAVEPICRESSWNEACWKFVASSVGFLADSYDLFTIDLVILTLQFEYGTDLIGTREKTLMASTMLLGTITGQLSFGYIADQTGRKWAFVMTAGLTILGAIASALVFDNSSISLPLQLALCRFLLGVGVGGEYPLSATVTAESAADPDSRGRSMAMVVSMQGWGMLLSSSLAILAGVTQCPMEYTWRLLLAFGAVPSAVAFALRLQLHESSAFRSASQEGSHDKVHSESRSAGMSETLRWTLVGTATSWFMMNFSLYSMGTFKSSILNDLMPGDGLGAHDRLLNDAKFASLTSIFALAGFFVAIKFINSIGRFSMQLMGFIALSIVFLLLSLLSRRSNVPAMVLLQLLGFMFLFQNFGPNTTTFIVPAESFPTRMRATCHGMSAACGKCGALLGVALLPTVEEDFGMAVVFAGCGAAALVGAAVTYKLTPRHAPSLSELEKM